MHILWRKADGPGKQRDGGHIWQPKGKAATSSDQRRWTELIQYWAVAEDPTGVEGNLLSEMSEVAGSVTAIRRGFQDQTLER